MAMDLVTVNLTRDNEKEHWGFDLAGGGKDKDVRLFINEVSIKPSAGFPYEKKNQFSLSFLWVIKMYNTK